jgi:hypothetical protein
VAIDDHGVGDYHPFFYRTHDYGRTWTKIVAGLAADQPSGSFARVIRSDTRKPGLLFAGTESSMYVSFDDGDTWQPLMLNLPNTSYRDIAIHENDLVAGTYGRSFWILDDISSLRQLTPAIATEPAHLFRPGDAIRVRRNVNGDTPFPPEVPHAKNPPPGALIDYYLSAPAATVALDVIDASGTVVRHLSNAPIPPLNELPPPIADIWVEKPMPMPATAGSHRVNWNIRYDNPPALSHSYEINGNPAETPASPEGALALPGVYTLKLTVDGQSYTQPVTVKNDPRSPATAADLKAQHDLQMKLTAGAREAWDGYQQVTAMRAALAETIKGTPPADAAAAAKDFDAKLAAIGGAVGSGRRVPGGGGGGAPAGGPPPPPNFVALQGTMIRQLETLDSGDMAPNDPMVRAYAAACDDLKKTVTSWTDVNGVALTTFNGVLSKNNLKLIAPASPPLAAPVCGAAPAAGARRTTGR